MEKDIFTAYEESGLDGELFILAPGRTRAVSLGEGLTYTAPRGERDEQILDRIERSLKAGRNLFAEEWKPFYYEAGKVY